MANTDLIILGMISLIPGHGYQLKKNIKETFGNPYFKLNNNVLYPSLAKMETEGFIKGKEMPGERMNKKVYHITGKGKKHLLKLVGTPVKPEIEDFDFKVQAVFFDLITRKSRLEIIKPLYESKSQELQETLDKKEKFSSVMSPISLTVLEYGIKEIENSLEFYRKLMEI
ncbi:MAG: PadR family transcriptional regulator [Methanobacterium sp.]